MDWMRNVNEGLNGFCSWSGDSFNEGTLTDVVLHDDERSNLKIRPDAEQGEWTSPLITLATPLEEGGIIIPSWQTRTPENSGVVVCLRVISKTASSRWFVMGEWACYPSDDFHRMSVPGQSDEFGEVAVDTFISSGKHRIMRYQLKVKLLSDWVVNPSLFQVAVQTSQKRHWSGVSETTVTEHIELDVPEFSQDGHRGEFTTLDGGGKNWCSSTSTAMVLAYHGVELNSEELAAIPPNPLFNMRGCKEPEVIHAALGTYDVAYGGTGNWSFNAAYAGELGLDASVRTFPSLREVEALIKQGTPVVISASWSDGKLSGSALNQSNGHLMVIRGFTKTGAVVVNDPATIGERKGFSVRRIYDRAELEACWNGAAYVIAPPRQ